MHKPIAVLAAAAGLAFAAAAWSQAPAKGAANPNGPAGRPALTVTTTLPAPLDIPLTLRANGNIAAWQEAVVGAEVGGLRLAEVRVNVGDKVARGQTLAVFAAETVEADLAVQRASLAEAEASLADARTNAERARTLADSGALSAQQISQYLTGEQTARARVEAARAQVRAQELRLKHTRVLAPDSGVISARSATVGAVASPGMELFRLVRQSRLEWRAEVTADELGRIRPGVTARVSPASGATLTGKVRMIGPTVDPQTRNALVYVDLPANDLARAGMFARGEFELGTQPGLALPQESVIVRDGFSYVFRLGADNRVQQTKVQTGRRTGDRIEIVSGLAPTERVVLAGASFLADGDLVAVSTLAKPGPDAAVAPRGVPGAAAR